MPVSEANTHDRANLKGDVTSEIARAIGKAEWTYDQKNYAIMFGWCKYHDNNNRSVYILSINGKFMK